MSKKVENRMEHGQPRSFLFRILDTPARGSAPSENRQPAFQWKPSLHISFLPDTKNVRIVTYLLLGAAGFLLAGCGGSESNSGGEDLISRETFIETYFQLRIAGLRSPQVDITLEARDEVLDEMGVTEDELLACVEYWGTDAEMMQGLWAEVDSLIRQARTQTEIQEPGDSEEGRPGARGNSPGGSGT